MPTFNQDRSPLDYPPIAAGLLGKATWDASELITASSLSLSSSGMKTLTVANTSGVLTNILSVAGGKGIVDFLGYFQSAAATGSIEIKLTIDGAVVFHDTESVNQKAMAVVGSFQSNNSTLMMLPDPLVFRESLLIQYSYDTTPGAGTVIPYRYRLLQ